MKAKALNSIENKNFERPVIGVFATCDPRIDENSRNRARNIVKLAADMLSSEVTLPDSSNVDVVYSETLIDGEVQADKVARQFKENNVNILIGLPDTWAFPQLSLISLLSHFPKDTPINMTCGNSGPKPGVVFTHAVSGAVSQYGGLIHINVGNWPDEGLEPQMSEKTKTALLDWLYAAVTYQTLKGKRVVVFGHDSMGMETALSHVIPTRNSFGIEITRLDMKLLADMLKKEAYDKNELAELKEWFFKHAKERIELPENEDEERFTNSLAMYLIVRDIMEELGAVGGGFMSQLEWGSDLRGIPLPVADVMESLFNSTFDHRGPKAAVPFATEADVQGLLTMLFMTYLSGGNPPLFMDFRKVWEPWELSDLAEKLSLTIDENETWFKRGLVDGNNSGSASFDWAAKPGTNTDEIMSKISFPKADKDYFPGLGNSVTFLTPAGIEGIAGRLAYSSLSDMFSLIWDEAETVEPPAEMAEAICNTANANWPHTFLTPKHANMFEYKHFAPANHLHMTWNLSPARIQYWCDLANVLSVTPWNEKKYNQEGSDRPEPLLYLLNGGEQITKMLRKRK